MPDPAITQIKEAFKARFEANTDQKVFIDRDDSEPIQEEERPCRVVRIMDAVLDERQEGANTCQQWNVSIFIDHYADVQSTDDLPNDLNVMAADTNSWIAGDGTPQTPPTWSMGGLLYELTPVSLTANSDDVPDTGVAVFELQGKFLTLQHDWNTIIF